METKTNELIKVVDGSGLESQTSLNLKERFLPFFEQAEQWKSKALELKVTDVSQTKEMGLAREARLALKKIRVEADNTRKLLKEDSLKYGKAVQGVYNVIEQIISPIEQYLEKQEKFAEVQEAKRKAELTVKREEELMPYAEFHLHGLDLGALSETEYQKYLSGIKLQLAAKIEEEKRIESEKEAEAKRFFEERERIKIENERLKKEAEAKAKELAIEREKVEKEKRALAERSDMERKELEAKLKKEREEKEKFEKEVKARRDEQELAFATARQKEIDDEKAKKLAEKKAANAPDKTKLLDFAMKLESMDLPVAKSDDATKITKEVNKLLVKVAVYIREQSKSL